MAYRIEFKPSAGKALAALPKPTQKRLLGRIEGLKDNPTPEGSKKLKGLEDLYRIRIGDYRVVYEVQGDVLLVLVVRIGHRRDVYRGVG